MLVPYPAFWTDTILCIGQRDVRDDQLCISGLGPFCLNQQLKPSKKAFSVTRLAWMCFRKSCGLTYVTSKFVVQSKRWYCMSFICSLDGSKKPRPTPIPKRKRKSLAHHAGGVHARCCRQREKELASNVTACSLVCDDLPELSRSTLAGLLGDEDREDDRDDDCEGVLAASVSPPCLDSEPMEACGCGSMMRGPRSAYRVVDDE